MARITALIVALALVAPAAVVAGGLGCPGALAVKGSCCCDSAGPADDAPAEAPFAQLERTCCCELERAPADRRADELYTAPPAPQPHFDVVAMAVDKMALVPPPMSPIPRMRARAPPPGVRSLFAQRTALLC
jgi:hypothetical protein